MTNFWPQNLVTLTCYDKKTTKAACIDLLSLNPHSCSRKEGGRICTTALQVTHGLIMKIYRSLPLNCSVSSGHADSQKKKYRKATHVKTYWQKNFQESTYKYPLLLPATTEKTKDKFCLIEVVKLLCSTICAKMAHSVRRWLKGEKWHYIAGSLILFDWDKKHNVGSSTSLWWSSSIYLPWLMNLINKDLKVSQKLRGLQWSLKVTCT